MKIYQFSANNKYQFYNISLKSYQLYLVISLSDFGFFIRCCYLAKVSYFFLQGKVRLCALLREYRINECKGCFFFGTKNWMNEWPVNFSRKKNTQNFAEKKKKKQKLIKKIGIHKKFKWITHELFIEKKKYYFFIV
mgnify:CR=1 FL=1